MIARFIRADTAGKSNQPAASLQLGERQAQSMASEANLDMNSFAKRHWRKQKARRDEGRPPVREKALRATGRRAGAVRSSVSKHEQTPFFFPGHFPIRADVMVLA